MSEWRYQNEGSHRPARLGKTEPNGVITEAIYFEYGDDPKVKGRVMAEALNVHEQTGMTPAQLQARVAELEAALEGAITQTDKLGGNSLVYRHIRWGTP